MIDIAVYLHYELMNKHLDLFENEHCNFQRPLRSPLSHRASSTVMLCLVHCTSLMLHFRYLQKLSSLLYNIIFVSMFYT